MKGVYRMLQFLLSNFSGFWAQFLVNFLNDLFHAPYSVFFLVLFIEPRAITLFVLVWNNWDIKNVTARSAL